MADVVGHGVASDGWFAGIDLGDPASVFDLGVIVCHHAQALCASAVREAAGPAEGRGLVLGEGVGQVKMEMGMDVRFIRKEWGRLEDHFGGAIVQVHFGVAGAAGSGVILAEEVAESFVSLGTDPSPDTLACESAEELWSGTLLGMDGTMAAGLGMVVRGQGGLEIETLLVDSWKEVILIGGVRAVGGAVPRVPPKEQSLGKDIC